MHFMAIFSSWLAGPVICERFYKVPFSVLSTRRHFGRSSRRDINEYSYCRQTSFDFSRLQVRRYQNFIRGLTGMCVILPSHWVFIGVGDGSPKIGKKYFLANYHVKFGHFVNFAYVICGQKCLAPQSWLSSYAHVRLTRKPPRMGLGWLKSGSLSWR